MEVIKGKCSVCNAKINGFGIENFKKNITLHLLNIHRVQLETIKWDGEKYSIVKKEKKKEEPIESFEKRVKKAKQIVKGKKKDEN